MNNSIPEIYFQCALFKNLEREVFMTHGYVDSHIIAQALRLRLKMRPVLFFLISICKSCSTLKCIRLH